MILKALLLSFSMVAGGMGMLQISAWLESYALLALGLLFSSLGVIRLMEREATARRYETHQA